MSGTPGQVWRGAPALGQDTELVLSQLLGYNDFEIAAFKEQGLVVLHAKIPAHLQNQAA